MSDDHKSIWNVDSLKVLMDERDRRYGEVQAAKEEAIRVHKDNADKWMSNANEWRGAMTDRERNFLPKSMGIVIAALSGVALLITLMEKFVK